jgi:hypothetical protein
LLWQIGTTDSQPAEFALAPGGYKEFQEDGFFVVGRSNAKQDWPYVHPGPADVWAGNRQHTFRILFALKTTPARAAARQGEPPGSEGKLIIDLIDTHYASPPKFAITINEQTFQQQMPRGSGSDASIEGGPVKGKRFHFAIDLPAGLLRNGLNRVAITSIAGSWALYDAVKLEAPGAELAVAPETLIDDLRSAPVLVQRDGGLVQPISFLLSHFGNQTDAAIHVNATVASRPHLMPGLHRTELAVPAVDEETLTAVAIEAAGHPLCTAAITLRPVRHWVVYLLPHSHNDIGYTDLQAAVERKQWANLDTALALISKTADYPSGARFKWNVEVMWAVDSFLREATPQKQQAFCDAVKNGTLDLGALYANELTALCRPEELLRLTECAVRVGRRCGVPVQSAMISDVPGCTWGMVPALAQAGVRYLSAGPNDSDRIGWTLAAWGDRPFWWVGPSGQERVLCWVAGKGYAFFHGGTLAQKGEQPLLAYLGQLQADGYPYDCVQMRYTVGGDNGPPDPTMCDFVRDWNVKYAYPKLVIATTTEMFRAFEQRYGDILPTARGDFTPYWEDGAASSARETALNRASAERLVQAETLFALLAPTYYPADEFDTAWRNIILYDEHTWGAWNSVTEPDSALVQQQWKTKQAFALEGDAQSRKLLAAPLPAPSDTVNAIDVFNTSSWLRTDLVVLPKDGPAWRGGENVVDADRNAVPTQRLTTGELVFLAREVPPLAARRYLVQTGPAPVMGTARAEGTSLQTATLTLRVNEKTGALASLRWEDRELVNTQSDVALNDYLYLVGGKIEDLQRAGSAKVSVRERGPLVASLLIESDAPGCRKLTREIRVIDGLDRVEILNVVDKKPVREKEGVHFGFGFHVPGGTVRIDAPLATVRPEQDQLPGACKNWFTVNRYVDLSNDEYGVTWATLDAPLVEIGALTANLPGTQPRPECYLKELSAAQQQGMQTIYSWAMNNHWHTNYRADQEGPTAFRFCLQPHGAYDPAAAARFGIECSQPLVPAPACNAGGAGEEVPASAFERSVPRLRVAPSGVLVTCLKPANDGRGLIVRLFNAADAPVKATLTWSTPSPQRLYCSDLSEQPGAPVSGPIDLSGRELVTLRAE